MDWALIYDFVFDRLRSVRQDAVIQRVDRTINILLLEPIVRFHTYAMQRYSLEWTYTMLRALIIKLIRFRLCERNISDFDVKINNKHLSECIKQLLVLYDQCDQRASSNMELHEHFKKLALNDNRLEMEALYILLHIGDQDALQRALTLSSDVK